MINKEIQQNFDRRNVFMSNVDYVDKLPMFNWVELNVTELCNRQCVFCPRVDDSYPNQNLNMSLDTVKKIKESLDALGFKGTINMSGFSEPLLAHNIYKIINELSDYRVELVTNGDRLNEKVAEKLFKNGLDYLLVSLYDGEHQIKEFDKKLSKFKGKYSLRSRWYDETDDYGLNLTNRAGAMNSNRVQGACYYPAYSIIIDYNGDILLCPQDWSKKVRFGNVHTESIYNMWTSPSLHKYRMNLIKGNRKAFPCKNCDACGTHMGENYARAWENI